jgi:hypothetical protein
MRIFLFTLVGLGLALFAAMLTAYLFAFTPFTRPPLIGRDLPSDFRMADKAFRDRVEERFAEMSGEALRVELQRQGFTLTENPDGKGGILAHFSKTSFPCTLAWIISWKNSGGTVSELHSSYGSNCL